MSQAAPAGPTATAGPVLRSLHQALNLPAPTFPTMHPLQVQLTYQVQQVYDAVNPYAGNWREGPYNWQTLIAGCFAIAAAWWTVRGGKDAARIQAKATAKAALDTVAATAAAAKAEVEATHAAADKQIKAVLEATEKQVAASQEQTQAIRDQLADERNRHRAAQAALYMEERRQYVSESYNISEILDRLSNHLNKLIAVFRQSEDITFNQGYISASLELQRVGSITTSAELFGGTISTKLRTLKHVLDNTFERRLEGSGKEWLLILEPVAAQIEATKSALQNFMLDLTEFDGREE